MNCKFVVLLVAGLFSPLLSIATLAEEATEQKDQVGRYDPSGPIPSAAAAVRVVNSGSCGSGSVCGRDESGSYILTNAHVAGTRVGRVVKIDAVVNGQRVTRSAIVKMAAYSDRYQTDWAVLYVADWQEIEPVPLSREVPTGRHYTRGSPRCVWPLVTTEVITQEVRDDQPLWRWLPNAIGGQSGSGVWSYKTHHQEGLLTWTWGGLGAGQQTHWISKQARQRSTKGPLRPTDGPPLIELSERSEDVIVETGFFQEVGINELPIWYDPDKEKPEEPETPDPESPQPETPDSGVIPWGLIVVSMLTGAGLGALVVFLWGRPQS